MQTLTIFWSFKILWSYCYCLHPPWPPILAVYVLVDYGVVKLILSLNYCYQNMAIMTITMIKTILMIMTIVLITMNLRMVNDSNNDI